MNIALQSPAKASSAISGFAYDANNRVLHLQFTRKGQAGPTQAFHGVPPDVVEAMQKADSIGRFYNTEIKGKYMSPNAVQAEG